MSTRGQNERVSTSFYFYYQL